MRVVRIYSLNDPDTNEVRYIGKTVKSLAQRIGNHMNNARKTKHNKHLSNWILKLESQGKKPLIKLIEECDESNWIEREKHWICQYDNLINLTKDGDGALGFVHSPYVKKKLSELASNRVMSDETKTKLSKALKGRLITEDHKKKIGLGNKGRKASLHTKLKLSVSHKGYKMPQEQKDKIRLALIGRKRPQSVIDKIKKSHINRNKDIVGPHRNDEGSVNQNIN